MMKSNNMFQTDDGTVVSMLSSQNKILHFFSESFGHLHKKLKRERNETKGHNSNLEIFSKKNPQNYDHFLAIAQKNV